MNSESKNILEIKKFDAWKRQQVVDEAILTAIGRAAKRFGRGVLGAAKESGKGLKYAIANTKRVYDQDQELASGTSNLAKYANIRNSSIRGVRYSSGKEVTIPQYQQRQREKIVNPSTRKEISATDSFVKGIQGAEDVIDAGIRLTKAKLGLKPVLGTKNTSAIGLPFAALTAIGRAGLDTFKNRLMTYDPAATTSQNRKNPQRTSFLMNYMKRLKNV